MFRNIGGKIKGLAKVFFTIGIVFSILTALVLCAAGFISGEEEVIIMCISAGLVYILLGILVAWLSNIMLYAFGQQVEMQEKSALLLESILYKLDKLTIPQAVPPAKPAPAVIKPTPAAPKAEETSAPAPAAAKPTCTKCGAALSEDAVFCGVCGNKM